ncbi:hypothetical protein [Salinimicrobium sp. TH3]|uniref:hypothetical protein n=1 Tax=Salinimicrobium sp. TH3 TaxID=2997342 RepID=UPI002272928E|nr:hypothetical protein [Salinimicrobium sp. TH3]MCY2686791.1 hypothetical protein [Salinimicrobium sp. TH3]
MRKTAFIASLLLILSCKTRTTEIRYYPTFPISKQDSIEKLDLDKTNMNFREITSWIGQNQYNEVKSVIEFKDGQILKKIKPYVRGNGLYRERNILSITSDSILIDDGYPISELKWLLKRHYTNNGKNWRYPDSSVRAGVEITLDTNRTANELKNSLINLTRTFDEVNSEVKDTLQLKFIFDYFRQIPPPPPPPKPDNINKGG